MTHITSKSDLIAAGQATRSLPTLGLLSWWSISDVSVSDDRLREICAELGIDSSFIPALPDDKASFIKAVRSLDTSALANQASVDRILIRKTVDDNDSSQFAVVAETIISGTPNYGVLAKLILDKKTNCVKSLMMGAYNPISTTVGNAIRAVMDIIKTTHDADSIRKMLLGAIKNRMLGVGIRPNGGIYFTHHQHDNTVDALARMVSMLSATSTFFTLGITDTEKTRANLFATMIAEITGDLEREAQEINKLLTSGANVRPETVERRLNTFKDLSEKAGVYESLLRLDADELKERIVAKQKWVEETVAKLRAKQLRA